MFVSQTYESAFLIYLFRMECRFSSIGICRWRDSIWISSRFCCILERHRPSRTDKPALREVSELAYVVKYLRTREVAKERKQMAQPEVVVLSGVRAPVGAYGGSLKDKPPTELAAAVVREAVKRAAIKPEEVGHVVFGNVIHTDTHDMYLARVAAVNGGLPVETPAFTLNRLCGSGLQAIVSAAQLIVVGDTSVAVAGGAEVMSRGQYWVPAARWGQRLGDGQLIDSVRGGLTDPFEDCHMGVTAENVAAKWGISRQQQDELALQSHQRAAAAIKAGYFKE